MTQHLPEKLLQQRLRLQLVSLESPSELPGSIRSYSEMGVSPMTELAHNLGDTSLGISPVQDSKRRLSMDSESSSNGSTPSPPERLLHTSNPDTPLSTITNIPKRILLHSTASSSSKAALLSEDPENKENVIPFASFLSPGKRRCSSSSSSSSSSSQRSCSHSSPHSHQMSKLGVSPAKSVSPRTVVCRAPTILSPLSTAYSGSRRVLPPPQIAPFSIFNDEEKDENRIQGGAGPLPPPLVAKILDETSAEEDELSMPIEVDERSEVRPVEPGSMEDILSECSPGKEEGIAPLEASPQRDEAEQQQQPTSNITATLPSRINRVDDGFDLDTLATITEDSETESPKFDLTALLHKKIILPSHLESSALYQQPSDELPVRTRPVAPPPRSGRANNSAAGGGGFKRPLFRRALSMLDAPTTNHNSALSIGGEAYDFSIPGFKRPNPPSCGEGGLSGPQPSQSKRRKCSPSSLPSKSSISMDVEEEEAANSKSSVRPQFHRSHSENELSIMKSCQLKEEVENILPDSSRLYALPCVSHDSKHPSLRSISCDTLANLMHGKFNHLINSYRIIDARYAFEFEGGHIRGAENWQHGEDEEFLSAFLPAHPLPGPPPFSPDNPAKRDILIFHCEFSSQRGPDFYRKLRERDRQVNQHVYPALYYPEVYLLHLGYKEFFSLHPDLCTGRYTTMVDPNHEHDLRKMRAKSKSWSGGTITRTGRMGRLHL